MYLMGQHGLIIKQKPSSDQKKVKFLNCENKIKAVLHLNNRLDPTVT